MKKIDLLILLVIIVLGFGLRFYKITQNPPSLNWDEVSIGYNAYSVLKTGKDEWNMSYPVHFKSYGEYKLPAQVYFSIPGIYLFGLTELGVRITPVIYGTLTVLAIFLLAKELFLSNTIGLLAAFLLSISPWHIQLTRGSFESSLATFFITLGVWFLIKGFKNQKWFILSMIPFALSVFTYNSARIFTPLYLFSILIIYRKLLVHSKKAVIAAILFFVILLVPAAPFLLSGERSARYKLVSVTDDPGLVPRINENRGKSNLSPVFAKLVHNKVTYTSFYLTKNYLSHFTPQFLFLNGAPHKQHHVQNIGELYLFQAPFLLLGIIGLYKLKIKLKGLLFSWLLLGFVPVSVTNDSIPHALRTLLVVPFYHLVSAFGFFVSINWVKKFGVRFQFLSVVLMLIVVLISVSYYLNQYYNIYPIAYSKDWQYGNKQVIEYIKQHGNEYDLIVYTRHYGEPHMFSLFYLNYDPNQYQNNKNLVRFETYDWVRVLKFDKFYFPDLGDKGTGFEDVIKENSGKRILFIGRQNDFPTSANRVHTINFLNGEKVFDLVSVK